MLTKNIIFKNFNLNKKNNTKVKKDLKALIKENNPVIKSLSKSYKKSYSIKTLKKFKKYLQYKNYWYGRLIFRNGSYL